MIDLYFIQVGPSFATQCHYKPYDQFSTNVESIPSLLFFFFFSFLYFHILYVGIKFEDTPYTINAFILSSLGFQ